MTRDRDLYHRLLGYVWPCWPRLGGAVLCMVAAAMTNAALPAMMQPLLDGAFINRDERYIFWLPILFVLLFFVRGMVSYLGRVFTQSVAEQVIMDLRVAMFGTLLDTPVSFHDRRNSGQLVSRFSYDATQIREACTSALITLVRDSLTMIGLLAWMLYLNALLAGICLLTAPLIIIVVAVVRRRLRRMSRRVQDTMGDLHGLLQECLGAHQVIKIHGGKEREGQRFWKTANAQRRFSMKFAAAAAASAPLIQFLTALILALIIYLAMRMAVAGTLSVGEFVSFFTAMFMLLAPIKHLAGVQEHVQRALAACENIFSLIDTRREDLRAGTMLHEVQGHIRFAGVSFSYAGAGGLMAGGDAGAGGLAPGGDAGAAANAEAAGDAGALTSATQDAMADAADSSKAPAPASALSPTGGSVAPEAADSSEAALENITLDIQAGETVALVGPSGSGKSTLVSLLARFHEPTCGTIYLDGQKLGGLNLVSLRRCMAYVTQEAPLFCTTVRDNVAYGHERPGKVTERQIWEALERVGARQFVEALPRGLDTVVGEAGSLLSGGQRQRLAIARALIKEARILILDEASSALDSRSEQGIRDMLSDLWRDRTCIIVAHRLALAETADRIVVLSEGRIVETGSHRQLMQRSSGQYQALHRAQFSDTGAG